MSSNRPFFAMLAAVVALGLYIALTERPQRIFDAQAQAPAKLSADLLFSDANNGAVQVFSYPGKQLVATFSENASFVRTVVRGLAQERIRRGMGPEQPFRLSLLVDGRLTLTDPTTQRAIELGAFGQTNAQQFAKLLTAAAPQVSSSQAPATP